MTIVVLIAVPEGLRGHLTRWMIEVAAGVFVGNPNTRIRDRLWSLLATRVGDGQATMIESAPNEQDGQSVPQDATAGCPSTWTD